MGPHCLPLYFHWSIMLKYIMQQTILADNIFRCFFPGTLGINVVLEYLR